MNSKTPFIVLSMLIISGCTSAPTPGISSLKSMSTYPSLECPQLAAEESAILGALEESNKAAESSKNMAQTANMFSSLAGHLLPAMVPAGIDPTSTLETTQMTQSLYGAMGSSESANASAKDSEGNMLDKRLNLVQSLKSQKNCMY